MFAVPAGMECHVWVAYVVFRRLEFFSDTRKRRRTGKRVMEARHIVCRGGSDGDHVVVVIFEGLVDGVLISMHYVGGFTKRGWDIVCW